ncbi:MAG: polysaccharide deacetylase family protein [Clostridia bacterium]
MILFNRLKNGKRFAMTMSYDDGAEADRRLVDIMNRYGIRGTFHLNSANVDTAGHVNASEFNTLYQNHEISCHGLRHRTMSLLPPQNVVCEILEDRKNLEAMTGGIVRGMSYANGAYDASVITALESCGMVYARTIQSTGGFGFPENFMAWYPTCHHANAMECGKRFIEQLERPYFSGPQLLYVWGHSYEFDRDNNWDMIEEFCQMMGGRDDIWYATNMEIYAYITAQRQLVVSVDNKRVYNPTAQTIWFTDDGAECCIQPGETLTMGQ